jgi:hypothetical protein
MHVRAMLTGGKIYTEGDTQNPSKQSNLRCLAGDNRLKSSCCPMLASSIGDVVAVICLHQANARTVREHV